jgi:hypothetical protein
MNKKKVLLFQYKWPLQIHGLNLLRLLRDSDFEVVYLVMDCETRYLGKISYEGYKFINEPKRGILERFFNKYIKKCLNRQVLNVLNDEISKGDYDVCLSIEKFAFVYLAETIKSKDIRHIHYSLELYFNNPGWFDIKLYDLILSLEKYYHSMRKVDFIIQSISRLKSYERYLGVEINSSFFLPVINSYSEIALQPKRLLNKNTISYIGNIEKSRFSEELANLSNLLDNQWTLLLHGPIFDFELKAILENIQGEKLRLSFELLEPAVLDELFGHSQIGICFYSNENENDKYIVYSSEKITRYLSHGVPVILNRNSESADFISKYNCGWVIDDLSELPILINHLSEVEYQIKSHCAKETFDLVFDSKNYSNGLIEFLSE